MPILVGCIGSEQISFNFKQHLVVEGIVAAEIAEEVSPCFAAVRIGVAIRIVGLLSFTMERIVELLRLSKPVTFPSHFLSQ